MPMPSLGLYSVENPMGKAMQGLGQAANTFAAMDKERPETKPKKTAGGGLMNVAGGAMAGAQLGSIVPGIGTGMGAAGGAVIGALAYFLS